MSEDNSVSHELSGDDEGSKRYKDEDLSDPKEAEKILQDVRERVFDEYDRAIVEGTSRHSEVEQNKKHVDEVDRIAQEIIGVVCGEDSRFPSFNNTLQLSLFQRNKVRLEAILHDALKLVPEREAINYSPEISSRRDELNQLNESIQESAVAGDTSVLEKRAQELRQEISDYEAEQVGIRNQSAGFARLLMHGEDSADFAQQLLGDMGFSSKFIQEIDWDIVTHMGMPFVEVALTRQRAQKSEDATFSAPMPERLDEDDRYPKPTTVEGAILFAADLLSPRKMAGDDIKRDPIAGCFDRYIAINLNLYKKNDMPNGLMSAFESARDSVRDNVERLKNPPESERRAKAAAVEKIVGMTLGNEAIKEINGFEAFVISQGIEIDGNRFTTIDGICVYDETEVDRGIVDKHVNVEKTMVNYYEAVEQYREYREKSVTQP